ncbi:MAG: hypothetical protein GKC10_09290 [Methanosarcinales archaeon]|nr:hypothetical protein [Methanosarcinales archaeon]
MTQGKRKGSFWTSRTGYIVEASALLVVLGVYVLNMLSSPYPVIDSFQATPRIINSGENSTLSWKVTGASEVAIDQGLGTVSSAGSIEISPKRTSTYTMTATNGTIIRKARQTVMVD